MLQLMDDNMTIDNDLRIDKYRNINFLIRPDFDGKVNITIKDNSSLIISDYAMVELWNINFTKNYNCTNHRQAIEVNYKSIAYFINCNFNMNNGFILMNVAHNSYVSINNANITGSYSGVFNCADRSLIEFVGSINFNTTACSSVSTNASFWAAINSIINLNNATVTGTGGNYFKYSLHENSAIFNLGRGTSNIPGLNEGAQNNGSFIN